MPAYDLDMVEAANGMRHHPPTSEDTVTAHELARSLVFGCLALLHEIVPASRDKSLMNTHLEDALMRANRAIAVNEGPRRGADLRMIAANLNAIMGDWARVGWQPDYPSDEEEQAHPPAARADATEERVVPGDRGAWQHLEDQGEEGGRQRQRQPDVEPG